MERGESGIPDAAPRSRYKKIYISRACFCREVFVTESAAAGAERLSAHRRNVAKFSANNFFLPQVELFHAVLTVKHISTYLQIYIFLVK